MKLYNNKQNLGVCRGPLHNLGQPLSTMTYAQKQSLLIYSECSHNDETMSQHNGLVNSQQYIQKTNYDAYGDTLFITEDYITDFLKTALTEDTWATTTSTDLASWLPRWCNLMKAACWIYIVGNLQVSACLQKSRNNHESLHVLEMESCCCRTSPVWPPLDPRWLWPPLTNLARPMGHEPCPHHFQLAHVARSAWWYLQSRL